MPQPGVMEARMSSTTSSMSASECLPQPTTHIFLTLGQPGRPATDLICGYDQIRRIVFVQDSVRWG